MTQKGVLRYLIAIVIVFALLSFALPMVGVPKSRMLPPPIAYLSAKGTATGYVTEKNTVPTNNLFKTGDLNYEVHYQFRGPATPTFGKPAASAKDAAPKNDTVYKSIARCTQAYYGTLEIGQTVPVRYDVTNPIINGITQPGGGANNEGYANILSPWIGFAAGILVVSYFVAMLLERIMLRESY